jgi:hypothetical protein
MRWLLEDSARTLIADEGFQEAFERLATLPVVLPRAIRLAFDSLPAIERDRLREHFAKRLTSPCLCFQAAALLLRGNETEQQCGTEILVALAAEESRDRWDLFHTILLWTESCLIADTAAGRSSSAPALAATWIHAVRLHQSLSDRNIPENVIPFLRAHNFSPVVAAFDLQAVSSHDVASPRSFSRTRLLLVGLSHQLSGVVWKEELKERLAEALTRVAFPGEPGLPSLRLLEQRSAAPNRLGSVLGLCDSAALTILLGTETVSRFSEATIEKEISEYINQLSVEPEKVETWICLAAYLKVQPPNEGQRPSLRGVLTALSFKAFVNPTFDQLQLIAMFVFGEAMYFGEAVEHSAWKAKLFQLAEIFADPSRRFPIAESALLLGNCAFLLAHTAPTETEAASRFSKTAGEIALKWPAAAALLLQPSVRVLLHQPSDIHAGSWRGVTEVRCAAEKLRSLKELETQPSGTSQGDV